MQEIQPDTRRLPGSVEMRALMDALADAFSVEIETSRESVATWYDSFDWRLYNRDYLLRHEDRRWHLLSRRTGEVLVSAGAGAGKKRVFARDLPAGRLRTLLEPVLDVRALLRLVTLRSDDTRVRILNRDQKTTVFVEFSRQEVGGTETVLRTVRLVPVRGYDKPLRMVRAFLDDHGVVDRVPPFYGFEQGLQAVGRRPGDYSSRFAIRLDPDLTSRQAAISIYRRLLETMLANEEGIIRDLDSEFLHDFRVAIRRTRSGLGQMKKVLPADITATMKEEFAYLGKVTGPVRDLDVYLLYESDYRSRLPELLQEGLGTFFADLAERRKAEQKKLVRALRSPRYRQIVTSWGEYLESDDPTPSPDADVPIIDLARKIIRRRYRRLMKDGLAIGADSPDEHLHRLRIQGKKLRYSLEFFRSLFPEREMDAAIRHLKRLQNNLGDFNDLSVQQEMLATYLHGLRPGSRRNMELAAAIGGLLTNLHHEQQRVRKRFGRTFARFAGSRNVALFKKLFH